VETGFLSPVPAPAYIHHENVCVCVFYTSQRAADAKNPPIELSIAINSLVVENALMRFLLLMMNASSFDPEQRKSRSG